MDGGDNSGKFDCKEFSCEEFNCKETNDRRSVIEYVVHRKMIYIMLHAIMVSQRIYCDSTRNWDWHFVIPRAGVHY